MNTKSLELHSESSRRQLSTDYIEKILKKSDKQYRAESIRNAEKELEHLKIYDRKLFSSKEMVRIIILANKIPCFIRASGADLGRDAFTYPPPLKKDKIEEKRERKGKKYVHQEGMAADPVEQF